MHARGLRGSSARGAVDDTAARKALEWFRGAAAGAPPALGEVDDATAALLVAARVAAGAEASGARNPLLTAAAVREFRRAATLEASTGRVAELLADDGVPFAIIKGAPLTRRFWPKDAVRDMGDIDVLVAPAAYPRAAAALRSGGYQLREERRPGWYARRWFYHEAFTERGRPILVELHWDFVRPGLGEPSVPELLDDVITVRTAAGDVPSPDDPWHLLVVCTHALHELFGLRKLLDIALVARALDEAGWARAVDVARRAQLSAALYYGVWLAAERLGTTMPTAVASLRPGELHDALVRRYVAEVPPFGSPGQAIFQLHHLATPFLHCRGARCLTRLPQAMLTDRSNIATDLELLRQRLRRGRS